MEDYKAAMTPLNPKNFHVWIKEVAGIAKKSNIWDYVDPEGNKEEPQDPVFPRVSDYLVEEAQMQPTEGGASVEPPRYRPAERLAELSDEQKSLYKMEMASFQMTEKMNDRISQGIRVVDAAIKTSARPWVKASSNGLTSVE